MNEVFVKWLKKRGLTPDGLSETKIAELEGEFNRELAERLFPDEAPPPAAPPAADALAAKDRSFELRVREMAPRSMPQEEVDAIVLQYGKDKNVDAAREALLKIQATRMKPVGTPEPKDPPPKKDGERGEGEGDGDDDKKKTDAAALVSSMRNF